MCEKGTARRHIAALILVLLAMTAYIAFVERGAPSFFFSPQQRVLSLSGAKETSIKFTLDELTALELYAGSDYGTPVDGGKLPLGGVRYGTWESETLGSYEAFFSEKIGTAIVFRTSERTAIFNLENEESTQELYRQLAALGADAK